MAAYNGRILKDIIFVRHGESEGNVASRDDSIRTEEFDAESSYHYRLTKKGRRQAKETGKWILSQFPNGFDAYLCSPFARTRETAALLNLPNAEWMLEAGLEEANDHIHDRFEDDNDISYSKELKKIMKETFKLQNTRRFIKDMQHVEAFITQYIFNNITNSERIIVVCHANVLKYIQYRLEYMSIEQLKDHRIETRNCEVFWYSRRAIFGVEGQLLPPLTWYKTGYWHELGKVNDLIQDWRYIKPIIFTNQDLLSQVEKSSPYLSKK